MRKSALKYVAVDHCARLADISDLLTHLSGTIGGNRTVAAPGRVGRGPQAKEEAVVPDKSDSYELKR
jgi:hypothetical protein